MNAHDRTARFVLALCLAGVLGPAMAAGQQVGAPEIDSLHSLELGRGAGGSEDRFGLVTAAARLPDGGLVVLDGMQAVLKLYDVEGSHIRDIGGRGDGPGEFREPSGLRVLGDSLVVLDEIGRRTFVGADGAVLQTDRLEISPLCGEAFNARYGGLLPDAALLVRCEERLFGRVRGEYRQSVQLLRVGREGSVVSLGVFPADTGRADPGNVPIPRPYLPRSLLLWSAAGQRVFVATSDSRTVLVHSASGERQTALQLPLRDRPTTTQDFEEASTRSMRFSGNENDRRVVREWVAEAPRAERTPRARSLVAAGTGELWVQTWEGSGDRHWWLVVNPRGEHERVLAPPNSDLLAAGRDWTLWLWRDEFDVEYVRLHRLR